MGSIALLSGVPQAVVANWKAKVVAYRKLLKGQPVADPALLATL